ncbi:MAG: hypothetical protein LBT38_06885 [Deltaproteobacteria bacterium]|jgi:hypothetical protein|nr:hypothetical protein [Deltaproteobacteria bacterium]
MATQKPTNKPGQSSLKPSPETPKPEPTSSTLAPPEIELANHEARQKRLLVAQAY